MDTQVILEHSAGGVLVLESGKSRVRVFTVPPHTVEEQIRARHRRTAVVFVVAGVWSCWSLREPQPGPVVSASQAVNS